MYPNLYYAFKDLFGVEWRWLKLVNSFGFFVAIAFLSAAWALTNELKRKQQLGKLTYTEKNIIVGAPATLQELVLNFLLGFIFGFKILGAVVVDGALDDPQSFILSARGSVLMGLLVGAVFAILKWYEQNKQKLPKPEPRVIRIWPSDRVGDMVIFAAIFGFGGAKIFHNLENWNDFIKNPWEALISFSGLTFYGGLICAGVAIILYARKHNITVIHLVDAFGPAMMLSYAVGRIGCQVAGDGDWGILNSAFASSADGHIVAAVPGQFHTSLVQHAPFYVSQFKDITAAHHLSVPAFWHLPIWLFAYNYPHNVIGEGVRIANCEGPYCSQLPIPVFPTPLYEVIACGILFGILWLLRTKTKFAGQLAGIYFILNGLERFLIEKIRVNTKYEDLPFQPTQAEIISLGLVLLGVGLLVWAQKKKIPAQG